MNSLLNKTKKISDDILLKNEIKKLLKAGQNIDQEDLLKRTPLMLAILDNKKETVKFLLKNGADITKKDVIGNFPLSFAIKLDLKDIVKEIIKEGIKRNKNFFNNLKIKDETPLTYSYLLKLNLKKIFKKTKDKDLIDRILNQNEIIKNILIYSEYNIDIYIQNKKGFDIFDYAKKENDTEMLNLLQNYLLLNLEIPDDLKEKKEEKLKNLKDTFETKQILDLNDAFSFI